VKPVIVNIMLGWRRGGLERAGVHYHLALTALDYQVTTIGHRRGWLRTQIAQAAEFAPLTPFSDYDFLAQRALRRMVRSLSPRLLIAHGNRAMRYAGRLSGMKRIGVFHNFQFKPFHADLDGGIAVSQAVYRAARQRLPQLPFEIVPNLVEFAPLQPRPARLGPIRLGALGRLHSDKAIDVLLQALCEPRLATRNWQLKLAGEGEDEQKLRRLTERLHLSDRVRFVGWYDDPNAFFQEIDILCMPSRQESFGLVLIEALAQAVPVVTSNAPGPAEIAAGGDNALVVPIDDAAALAAAIERLIDNEDWALKLGRRGQANVRARYSFEVVARQLDDALMRLCCLDLSPAAAGARPEDDACLF
jgi:glycosyltransferase involved in cell wall biosynthesis